ncbi:MAG: hypothetical protein Q9184_002235 [Pyrenodesmia sp. 2 TL-2023]
MYRVFPIVQFRRLLMASLLFVVALTIACVVTSVFQCVPIHAFWESFGGKLAPLLGGRCVDVRLYFLISGSIMTVTDFVLLALPIPVVWRLRTGRSQKVLLTAIFTVGLVVCIVSIVRLVVLSEVDESDITCKWPTRTRRSLPTNRVFPGNYVPAAIWSAAEASIAVVSACLPSLRPLFVRLIWKDSKVVPRSKHRSLASWRSPKTGPGSTQGSFNRLQEFSSTDEGAKLAWRQHSVTVLGGRPKRGSTGHDVEEGESEEDVPLGRIRAKTQVVVSISERVDWRDDLF